MSSDYVYYNGSIVSQVTPGTNIFNYAPNQKTPAEFYEQRSSAILKNPSQYSVSVASFQCPLQNQPIRFIKQNNRDIPNPPKPLPEIANQTYYYVTLGYNGIYSNKDLGNLVWAPEGLVSPESKYYYALYTVGHFITILNNALFNAFVSLSNNVTSTGVAFPDTFAPFYVYNKDDFTITLVADFDAFSLNIGFPIEIYMNTELYDIFYNLPAFFQNGSTDYQNEKKNYLILVQNLGDNIYDQTDDDLQTIYYRPYTYPLQKLEFVICTMDQEYSTLWNLSTIQNILITTGTMPINTENQPPQIIDESLNNGGVSNSASNFLAVLTSFQIAGPVDNTWWSSRQRIVYSNDDTTQNRNIQMHGELDLNKIDIQIFLQYRDGSFYKLYLDTDSTISFKLAFNKMDVTTNKKLQAPPNSIDITKIKDQKIQQKDQIVEGVNQAFPKQLAINQSGSGYKKVEDYMKIQR